jgi:hypothetical protein
MLIRLLIATCCVAFLCGCDEAPKNESKQNEVCRGLARAECTANPECKWSDKKEKCKQKDDSGAEQSLPPEPDQGAPTQPTPDTPPQ